ncbi:MAG: Non-canonical purine NTP pyrophosphatase [Desulfobulbus propionicus]|nr:MAG: Non-canonical purine NTP pyrophosphatase [Desulfobulbus propionicus]
MNNVIVLATTNTNKVKEIQTLLENSPLKVRYLSEYGPMPSAVEDGETFDENAYKKALHYSKVLGLPCLADDSGLAVQALNGSPGVYSARYAGDDASDADNCEKLLKEMEGIKDRAASFFCVLSLATPGGPALTWEGRCDGEILTAPRGKSGFGYDPLFYFPAFGKTFAEVDTTTKSSVSHRGLALREFAADIDKVAIWLNQRMAELKPPKPDHSEFEHNDWSEERMV